MMTKLYQYQLALDSWDGFVELQRRIDALYSKHISYEISFVRSSENPSKITEIHVYPDSTSLKKAESLHALEPELSNLFDVFVEMLDPTNKQIEETTGETLRLRD